MANRHWLQNLGVTQFIEGQGFIYVDSDLAMELITNNIGSDTLTCAILTGGHVSGGSTSPSALLELQSAQGAILLSRMSTLERDALTGATNGMIIYNTTANQFEFYQNSNWVNFDTKESVNSNRILYSTPGKHTTTIPSNYNYIKISAIGGGGGGAGHSTTNNAQRTGGCGGAYAESQVLSFAALGTRTVNITVGQGGASLVNGVASVCSIGDFTLTARGGEAGSEKAVPTTSYSSTPGFPDLPINVGGGGGINAWQVASLPIHAAGQAGGLGGGGGGAGAAKTQNGSTFGRTAGGTGGGTLFNPTFGGAGAASDAVDQPVAGKGWVSTMGKILIAGGGGGGANLIDKVPTGANGGLFGGGGGGAPNSSTGSPGVGGTGGSGGVLIELY